MPRSRPTAGRAAADDRPAEVDRAGDARGFFETLGKSDLLAADRVAELEKKYGRWSPQAAADELIRAGLLSRYQADRVRMGRYRGFFLDRYRLLAVLGAGGMGTVYVARDEGDGPHHGQKVALKVLAEGMRDDAGMIARLKYEGVAAGRVDHPNVVHALRFCKADNGPGDHLLVMEFVEAVSAEELLIRGGAVKSAVACDIARQAALGLAACHEAHLIHRDVKPANLLVAADGAVKVADFGLALLTDQAAAEFSLQMIFGHDCLGSADYMAPEQSRNSTEIDVRADLYSLGCTLYSLLTARVPYPAKSRREVLKSHRHAPVPDVRLKAPDTPATVAELVTRLMSKDPADRPADATEVAALLEPHARRKPIAFNFDKILNSRARAAAAKSDRRRKEAALKAKRKATDDAPSTPPLESDRETKTTADLDTARPDSNRYDDRSSILTASSVGRGRSAADLASEILGSDIAGSQVRDSLTRLSHVGRRLGSDATADSDSSVIDDWSDAEKPPAAEPAPSSKELPSISPPTRLVPTGLAGWFLPQIPVRGGRLTIGHSKDCAVQLSDAGVAEEHCEFRWDGRGWSVADLGGGTAINEAPIHGGARGELGHGDDITFGSRTYTMRIGAVRKPIGPWIVAGATALAAAVGTAIWVF
ncbi:FHA domain-containing serine/threonine-protein kinase [Alienimonas chondri]|uniref:Serine/threonine-protein kinase PknD n=1 Tax=Alienimonas chondri TaxID=2681879 RepID=A0ABX1VA75_9PLAN|nr:FHA domain-containing serine/threonine-protein kinase [Alienimonas chondri]NNJ24806.1 Serine/threonine-protein kinase PknD [Alienimonas chondri]